VIIIIIVNIYYTITPRLLSARYYRSMANLPWFIHHF